ncbi:MAG TPA: 50S ribosomal protein L18 [Clostridiales bacterium]|nr:50S ribosomal protein L18 [Clostridiales bacterium]
MINRQDKNEARQKRHGRVRNKISGTSLRPRLSVYRSTSEIYAQLIDDEKGVTLVSASTLDKEVKPQLEGKTKTEQAQIVGEVVAKRAIKSGLKQVVFDRGGYLYIGRVKALAESARSAGLEF